MNIIIYLGDSSGWSEEYTKIFADSTYDDIFGTNTDGVFYYMDLSEDNDACDYISTSGIARIYFDNHIDDMFEKIFEYLPDTGEPVTDMQIQRGIQQILSVFNEYYNDTEESFVEETSTDNLSTESYRRITDFNNSVIETKSSSQLATEKIGNNTYDYSSWRVIDNDLSTCWSEGSDDYGSGESITLSFDNVYEINEIRIWNGLCASEDLFYKNSRLREISVAFSDGQSIDFECNDGWNNSENVITLPSTVETSSITITIGSVYEGEKYKDTCISEIRVS